MKYRQIVFDIDGTLINSEYKGLQSLQDVILTLSGRKVPLAELTFALGIPGEDSLKRLGFQDSPGALELWDRYGGRYWDTVTVFPGIRGMLNRLSRSGCGLGIVTSETRLEYNRDFCRFGLGGCFRAVVCAEDAAEHKPHPAPLLRCLELLGAAREESLYVGDSVYDSLCAQGAGVDFALAGWGTHDPAIPARYCLEKPACLLELLSDG